MIKSGSPSAEGSFHSKQSCRTEKGLGTIECRTGRFPKGKKHCPASDENLSGDDSSLEPSSSWGERFFWQRLLSECLLWKDSFWEQSLCLWLLRIAQRKSMAGKWGQQILFWNHILGWCVYPESQQCHKTSKILGVFQMSRVFFCCCCSLYWVP